MYTNRADERGTNLYAHSMKSINQVNTEQQARIKESYELISKHIIGILQQLNFKNNTISTRNACNCIKSWDGNQRSLEWFKHSENKWLLNSLRYELDYERHVLNLYGITEPLFGKSRPKF